MRKWHNGNPLSLPRPTFSVFLDLLAEDSGIDPQLIQRVVDLCREDDRRSGADHDPIGAVLSILHPRMAALCDMRLRASENGRITPYSVISVHADACPTQTKVIIDRAYRLLHWLLKVHFRPNVTWLRGVAIARERRRVSAALRKQHVSPYRNVPGMAGWLLHQPSATGQERAEGRSLTSRG